MSSTRAFLLAGESELEMLSSGSSDFRLAIRLSTLHWMHQDFRKVKSTEPLGKIERAKLLYFALGVIICDGQGAAKGRGPPEARPLRQPPAHILNQDLV